MAHLGLLWKIFGPLIFFVIVMIIVVYLIQMCINKQNTEGTNQKLAKNIVEYQTLVDST